MSLKRAAIRALSTSRLYAVYHRLFGRFDPRTIDFFINEYSRTHRDIFFIQVGANDGVTWDPYNFFIRRDRWRGIVIEPQPHIFESQLKSTYQGVAGVRLMNVAVDAVDGRRPLYRYSFSSSRWASGLASFDKTRLIDNFATDYIQDHIRQEQLVVDPDDYVTTDMVECVSFHSIVASLESDRIDFLITDVEGYDVQILETFPFDLIRPRNIVFELPPGLGPVFHGFLAKLRSYDYHVFISRNDAIAMSRSS